MAVAKPKGERSEFMRSGQEGRCKPRGTRIQVSSQAVISVRGEIATKTHGEFVEVRSKSLPKIARYIVASPMTKKMEN